MADAPKSTNRDQLPIICFGEMLVDKLPSGRVPGGAPMNVAYHLRTADLPVHLVSRIGNDEEGSFLCSYLEKIGLKPDYVQRDDSFATGTVSVQLMDAGIAKYTIHEPVAWDFIEEDASVIKMLSEGGILLFGSLAARNHVSRNTLFRYLELAEVKICDINLRPPFIDPGLLYRLMEKTDILKVNEEEWIFLQNLTGIYGDDHYFGEILAQTFGLRVIILTRGSNGASCFIEGKWYHEPGISVEIVDTVGSGDAFLAGFLIAAIADESPQKCLQKGSEYGSKTATHKGAIP
jgi:fructokinase